jgi:hypothetical protein
LDISKASGAAAVSPSQIKLSLARWAQGIQ